MSATPISVPVSVIWTVRSTGQSAEATPATPLQVSVAQVHIGLKGAQGLQGLQGLQGYKGDKGDKGDTGDVTPAAEAALEAAVDARNDALTHAGVAGVQAGVATTKAAEAAASVVLADAARDAAFVNADVYADVATGLAAVADGEQFQVVSADGLSVQRWRRDAGPVAVAVGVSYPTVVGIDAKIAADDTYDDLLMFLDVAGRILARIDTSGRLHASMGPTINFGSGVLSAETDATEDLMQITDATGRLLARFDRSGEFFPAKLASNAEVVTARGTVDSLGGRLSAALRPSGFVDEPLYGAWNLRETGRISAAILAGAQETLVISQIGDSWTDNPIYGLRGTTEILSTRLGKAGAGYMGFRTQTGTAIIAADATYALSSGWVTTHFTVPGPHIRSVKSSTAGHSVVVTSAAAGIPHLLYKGGVGSVRYRYNGGGWEALLLDGVGTQSKALTAPPAGPFSMDMEVVSGECELYGFDVRGDAGGVRVHNLGAGSTRLSQWLSVDESAWVSGLAALDPRLTIIQFGVNDAYWYDAATFSGHLTSLIARVRAAAPLSDVLLVSPPQTLATNMNFSMRDFQVATRSCAKEVGCAHLDLQMYYGQDVAAYGEGGLQYIVDADTNHPTQRGADINTAAIVRSLTV